MNTKITGNRPDVKLRTRKARIGRNDPCPCGSGRKYKKCCTGKKDVSAEDLATHYLRKYDIRLKPPRDIEGIRRAGAGGRGAFAPAAT